MSAPVDKKAKRATEAQRIKNLERALRLERTGLIAIALAFVKEAPDPGRLLGRLERMAEAAALNPKTPTATAAMFEHGVQLIRRALEQELGKPQGLFDPHVGHVSPGAPRELLETPAAQPVSLLPTKRLNSDREAADRQIWNVLVQALAQGPATDAMIAARYAELGGPKQSRHALYCHRVALYRLGRIAYFGNPTNSRGGSLWGLTEQQAAA